jgi:hypothetical protein
MTGGLPRSPGRHLADGWHRQHQTRKPGMRYHTYKWRTRLLALLLLMAAEHDRNGIPDVENGCHFRNPAAAPKRRAWQVDKRCETQIQQKFLLVDLSQ